MLTLQSLLSKFQEVSMEYGFSEKDLTQIATHDITVGEVERQLGNYRKGFAFLPLERPATAGDGILELTDEEVKGYAAIYGKEAASKKVVKFVPASGAATRMFKDLFGFVETGKRDATLDVILAQIGKFAFHDRIKESIGERGDKEKAQVILGYGGALPKALILFHSYPEGPRTAFEEHMVEGAMYAASGGKVHLHFTVSPEHRAAFDALVLMRQRQFEDKYGVSYDISFSEQLPSTDTIAVTPENKPFRNEDGSLLFRPGGHGALIENLGRIYGDIIFIKTVDNVAPDHLKTDTILYKQAIRGILADRQKKVFAYLARLDAGATEAYVEEMAGFVEKELMHRLPEEFAAKGLPEKKAALRDILDRPLRVCGMVRNEGEPGGGPFWVRNTDGSLTLQIAEPTQISPGQRHLLKEGTHFNPVDLVCGVKNYKGERFDLRRFVDQGTGFISEKTKNGRPLKAQELPGLWNGAMAGWNTIFVEVPVSTFSPVKELADLLKPAHQ